MVTIDGTDMKCQMRFNKKFNSHKFKKGGLRYEVGVCILTGDIVWIHGPFRAGLPDIQISRSAILKGALVEGEMCEADNGYVGEDWYIKTPLGFHTRTGREGEMKKRAGQRHETVNSRLKIFKVLGSEYHHDLTFHSSCFRAVAVITQLNFRTNPPFQCEYYDDK